LIGKVTTAANM